MVDLLRKFPESSSAISDCGERFHEIAITENGRGTVRSSVAEPKLFDSAPAPAPTFKKFLLRSRLWLRLELCGCLFSQLLNEKVDFS